MKLRPNSLKRAAFLLLAVSSWMPIIAHAQNTVYFNTTAAEQTKSIANWGVEVAWVNADNMRQSIANMGASQIDLIAGNFYLDEPLQANGDIGPNSKAAINAQMQLLFMAGNKPYVLGPTVGNTNAYYLNGSALRTDRYSALIKATKQYIETNFNTSVAGVMPFNEPDFWTGQGSTQDLNTILTTLKNDPSFQNTALIGGSTLNSDLAQTWYDPIAGVAGYGSTHVLGGSANSYANFFQHVTATGKIPSAPELHGLGEAIYAAQYGAQQGLWWGGTLRARGLFVQSSDGKQLGYAENRPNDTAAAVYRAPDGQLRAFAGGFERMGASTAYRFVSTDRDVYFNGVGPIREYMVQVGQGQDAFADIDYDSHIIPALDGNRWEIVNRQNGLAMEVTSGGLLDGAGIGTAIDTGALNQRWNIVRNPDGYYAIFNANSGRTAEVADSSLINGAAVRQWGMADNLTQHWYIEEADPGYFYIRNGNSNKFMTGGGRSGVSQSDSTGAFSQQWQLVLANPAPTGTLAAHYAFDGNAADSAGTNHGIVSGNPVYASGPIGQAIKLDGADDYVKLPSGVANSHDITVAAWVYWNGGSAWQRILDFGNDTNKYMFLSPSSGDNTMRFAITTGSNTAEQILDTDPLPVGQWVHLAVTLSGNTGVMYVNGAPRVAGQIMLNPDDINSVNNYIGKSQWPDPLFNGMIDDFRIYNYALDQTQIASLVYGLQGDYNGDGVVDAADYTVWRDTMGSSGSTLAADGNHNGTIDAGDYDVWRNNFGAIAGSGSGADGNMNVAVPEPATLIMLLGGILTICSRCRAMVS
jgi:hypothetical protein